MNRVRQLEYFVKVQVIRYLATDRYFEALLFANGII